MLFTLNYILQIVMGFKWIIIFSIFDALIVSQVSDVSLIFSGIFIDTYKFRYNKNLTIAVLNINDG